MDNAPIRVAIVPHTHWDREWYLPFQRYRLKLVRLLDDFLALLDQDPSYTHFTLDGQTAVIDDYLAMRPHAAEQISALVTSRRMSIGPWAVLMDEYMVSGETIIRNLAAGLARSADFGGAMDVAYLPDMFGHVAQMPQLLRLADFTDTVLWRGVPSQVTHTGFDWTAPDGSTVRAEFLYGSYSNGRDLADDPDLLVQRAQSYLDELGNAWLGSDLLLMNGTDHQVPQPWLGSIVQAANQRQDRFEFRITSLSEYLNSQPRHNLVAIRGELRSGAQSNVLMGVASNRVDIHQVTALAERRLERVTEPLWAAIVPAPWPAPQLEHAWRFLILNAAHDSSCACSDDEVVDEVMVRYRSARQIADGLIDHGLELLSLGVDCSPGDHIVVNTTPTKRSDIVVLDITGTGPLTVTGHDDARLDCAIAQHPARETFSTVVEGTKIGWVLEMLRGSEFAGRPVAGWRIAQTSGLEAGAPSLDAATDAAQGSDAIAVSGSEPSPAPETVAESFVSGDEADVAIVVAAAAENAIDTAELRDVLELLAKRGVRMRVSSLDPPSRTVKVFVPEVPGCGWTTIRLADTGEATGPAPAPAADRGLHTNGPERTSTHVTLSNELLTVTVDADSGEFALDQAGISASGLGRIVEGGDGGDTYNYSPPREDRIVEAPASVSVAPVEDDGLTQSVVITRHYDWPAGILGDDRRAWGRTDQTIGHDVVSTLEVRRGEPFVRVTTTIENRCTDHRIRAHFPLPGTATHSSAECAFAVVERGLSAEGGLGEVGLPTFVSRRFVEVPTPQGSLLVIHDGLYEYEVVRNGSELAVTLLRATGWLARREPDFRPNPAGPQIPVVGAQMLGTQTLRYAVSLGPDQRSTTDAYALADQFLVPCLSVAARPVTGAIARHGTNLEVSGCQVSAVERDGDSLRIRVFNPRSEATLTTLRWDGLPLRGWIVNLRGRPLGPFTGEITLEPHQIVTVQAPAPFPLV